VPIHHPSHRTKKVGSNDARAIHQLDEIAACEPRIQGALVYHVHAIRRRLAFSSGRVASEHRHVVVRVVEEAKAAAASRRQTSDAIAQR
jgi:hypothetical protein